MENFIASKWSFAYFDRAFAGTKISFGDLDGIVEVRSNFCVMETKGTDVPVPTGQAVMFSRLHETGYFTILVLRGTPPDNVVEWAIWPGEFRRGTREDVYDFLCEWFAWAKDHRSWK